MSFLTLSLRHLRRNGGYTLINVFGLSLSMAACLLIFQYAFFELSFDRQFAPGLYRLGDVTYENGVELRRGAWLPYAAGQTIREQVPEVKNVVRMASTSAWFDCSLSYTEGERVNIFNENKGFWFADPSFLILFSCEVKAGDPVAALSRPYSIVLTETAARKYFGDKDPIGKTLHLRGSFQTQDYTVTAVVNDFPVNSHLEANIIASLNSLSDRESYEPRMYVQLEEDADPAMVLEKINGLKSMRAIFSRAAYADKRVHHSFLLEPVTEIHLHTTLGDYIETPGSAVTVYALIGVAMLVLFVAWINYVNLASSKSVTRAREVGIRKVTGATSLQIAVQFLTETLLLNGISIAVAIFLVSIIAPGFYRWIGLPLLSEKLFLFGFGAEAFIVYSIFFSGTILSGMVPAWALSLLSPVHVLKGKFVQPRSGFSFRKVAVVFQFACAFLLAVTVIVFREQISFMKKQELGISIDRSLVLKAPTNVDSSYLRRLKGFKDELSALSVVHQISTSTEVPGNYIGSGWSGDIRVTSDGPASAFGVNLIDHDFIALYGLKLLAGRNFSPADFPGEHFGSKVEPVILNRMAASHLGFTVPENAIGINILWGENTCRIVGVLEDFHQRSVKEPMIPVLFVANMGPAITLKLTEGTDKNLSKTLAQIRDKWNAFFPNNAFDYFFLEDHFNKQYVRDERMGRLFNIFCGLALTVSFLGLFALSLFSLRQRMKEISIRKVLGASMSGLIGLLSKEYFLLVALGMTFAMPLAWLGVNEWLKTFALRIELRAWYFVAPVGFMAGAVALTMIWQVMRAARRSSVELLREE